MLGFILLPIYFYSKSTWLILKKQRPLHFSPRAAMKWGGWVILRNKFWGRGRPLEAVMAAGEAVTKAWPMQTADRSKGESAVASSSEGKEGLISRAVLSLP